MRNGDVGTTSDRASRATGAILLAAALALAACGGGGRDEPAARHLVLITLDTVRADRLGCYGRANAATPWLDALAQQGVRFERAYAQTPLTLPSHASILTGLLPTRTGIHVNGQTRLDPEATTLAERLAREGFFTAAAVGGFPVARRFPTSRGFARFDDLLADRRNPAGLERDAAAVVRAALDLAGERDGRRLFLWVHLFDAHDPYVPPAPFRERFENDPYQGEVASMDAALADLEAGLRSALGAEEILFAVIADHGESLGEHGEDTHGFFLYEPTVRIPFLLSGPRIPRGRTLAGPVRGVDLVPTVLDRLGLAVPAGLDGRILDLAAGDRGPAPRVYIETELPLRNYGWSPLYAVVDGTLKYVEAPRPEAYDLRADPGETHDLAGSLQAETSELRAWLATAKGQTQTDTEVSVDPRLQSLGYVGTSARPAEGSLADPKDRLRVYAKFQSAGRALEDGRPQDALPLLEELLRSEDSSGLRFQRARALRMQGLLAEASSELDRVGSREPAFPGIHMERARIAIARGDAATTLRETESHLAEAPEDAEALMFRGAAREISGAIDAAEADYRRALAVNPLFGSASLRLAALCVRAERIAEAKEILRRHVELHPDDGLARGLLGSI